MGDKKVTERTEKVTPLFSSTPWYKTTVTDKEGNVGVGWSQDKQESIEKAYKDLREKRGR